ncbi:MAG: hypothetical protein ACK5VJ_00775 [Pseudomonadota bacterium]
MEKPIVAVLFGGPSAEHDVSILTGLQVLEALDPARFESLPVYIDTQGRWWVGHESNNLLRKRSSYLPDATTFRQLQQMFWPVGAGRVQGRFQLLPVQQPFFGKAKPVVFDIALPALHGTWGEEGLLQGALQSEGVPMACGRTGPMALAMHKLWCQQVAAAVGVPTIPTLAVGRDDAVPTLKTLKAALGAFPLFVKPNALGSSIGASRVADEAALHTALANVLRLDTCALIQPCVEGLIEYNVAVRRLPNGKVLTSAMERPLVKGESYDFKTKYLAEGGAKKAGNVDSPKLGAMRGMLGSSRTIHPPELETPKGQKLDAAIRAHAIALFNALELSGMPRLDFMVSKKGELYFNEINPIPGSFGFFLWEAAKGQMNGKFAHIGFTGQLTAMLEEARAQVRKHHRTIDPTASGGQIFTRRG